MTRYDHIVIGGGNTGCVVAARLSEDPGRSVLLLEAGGSDRRLAVLMPAAAITQFGTAIDWDYLTEPEPALEGRRLRSPRGKVLGGCSSMNVLAYVRGNRVDYDEWAAAGAQGWSYDEVLPYFRRSEDNQDFCDEFHGRGGPLTVERLEHTDPIPSALVEGAVSVGLPRNDDFNGASQDGVGAVQITRRNGVRLNASRAFLRPAMKRKNLTVALRAQVTRLVLDGTRAVAVEYLQNGRLVRAESTGDIVVSAGSFGTPALLQHSGIGPADHLRSVGITPVVDLPAVGAHLMEHPFASLPFELTGGGVGMFDVQSPRHLAEWLVRRTGKLSSNIVETGGHWRTDSSAPAPNIQLMFAAAHFTDHGQEQWPAPTFTIAISYLRPSSTGSVLVPDNNPLTKPLVKYNLLSEAREVDEMVEAILLARDIAASGPMKEFTGRPAGALSAHTDRQQLSKALRQHCQHTYHPACTARIGTAQDGAVGPDLRVHGVSNLRIADVSVMPRITRGNTQAPAYMIGEKAADLVLGRPPLPPRRTRVPAPADHAAESVTA
ncbi:GMC family oxidoreductase [Mycolicibacterium sp.]|uniref:GMC family oxidoreductase n=1 Tax=Mycolicibacterium sp. TaxID=2320850 RepID=UPI003D150E7B